MTATAMYVRTASTTRTASAQKRMKVGKSAQDLNYQGAEVMQIMTMRYRMKGFDPKERYSKMATERGISYGQMVTLLERGENNGTKK